MDTLHIGLAIVAGIMACAFIVVLSGRKSAVREAELAAEIRTQRDAEARAQQTAQAEIARVREAAQADLTQRMESWKANEAAAIAEEQRQLATASAGVALSIWKETSEIAIREDAIARSRRTIIGKVSEQIIPFQDTFPFNPKDVRFIGSPIDLIVFDGCDDGAVERVVFIEVKSGASTLSPRQRMIRDAVTAGRVEWREMRS